MTLRQSLPNKRQAARGVTLAAANAWTHIECAEALREARHFGAASAHLVLAVEEAVKARVFYKWPRLVRVLSSKQLRDLLYTHQVRHAIAVLDSMSPSLRRAIVLWQIDHPGTQMSRRTFASFLARHDYTFSLAWVRRADRDKQRGMHVDWDGRTWRSPAAVTEAQYQRRFVRCLEFVIKTNAAVGLFDEIRDDLVQAGWDIDEDRL